MKNPVSIPIGLLLILAFVTAACTSVGETAQTETQPQTADVSVSEAAQDVEFGPARMYPVVEPGRFDNGKMWTFEHAPAEYFLEEYNLELTEEWRTHAKMGSVRLPNCTGSFVSRSGLILTNHHCTREEVTAVTQNGENLTEEGFYATDLSDERMIPGFYVDQVIAAADVTEEIYALAEARAGGSVNPGASHFEAAAAELAERMDAEHESESYFTEITALYNGALYSAYTYRRYSDIRLVMVPELEVGYFGGDPDNFTYPRYTLDMALLRAYEDDQPFEPDYYYRWSENGSSEGDAVFVVGNPGSTSRLNTVAQLEYTRDVSHPAFITLLEEIVADFITFEERNPVAAAQADMRNYIFQIQNAIKAYSGGLKTLEDPEFMGRRFQSELQYMQAVMQDYSLTDSFGSVLDDIEDVVDEKHELADPYFALLGLNAGTILSSGTLQRSMLVGNAMLHRNNGNEQAASYYLNLVTRTIEWHEDLEMMMIESRFNRIADITDSNAEISSSQMSFSRVSGGKSAAEYAEEMRESALLSVASTLDMIEAGIDTTDTGVRFGMVYGPVFEYVMGYIAELEDAESELNRSLGRARYEVYGTAMPPDATFSIRLQDGRVASYKYNGTRAPAYTTFFGLLNRHYAHGEVNPWSLPYIWKNLPSAFPLSTPLNLVTTNDIIGGNSGSPLLSRNLELVGLIFDGNIESLSGDFIYTDETARAISVDSRGMLEALRHVYRAERVVQELLEK